MYYQDNYNTFGQQTEDEEEQKKRQYSRYGTGWWDRTAEFLATNPLARGAGFVMQGIANSGLNPAGYIARAAGMDTQPLQQKMYTDLQSAVQRFPGHDLNVNNAVSNQQHKVILSRCHNGCRRNSPSASCQQRGVGFSRHRFRC